MNTNIKQLYSITNKNIKVVKLWRAGMLRHGKCQKKKEVNLEVLHFLELHRQWPNNGAYEFDPI